MGADAPAAAADSEMISWQLLGPTGVGKTTLGQWLAPRLGLSFVDLDSVLSETYAVSDLASCVREWGAEGFHQRSLACLAALEARPEACLIAVGAGSQWAAQGRGELLKYPSLYLRLKAAVLWERNRQLRQDPRSFHDFIGIEYSPERQQLAAQAQICVDLTDLQLEAAQSWLLELLQARMNPRHPHS